MKKNPIYEIPKSADKHPVYTTLDTECSHGSNEHTRRLDENKCHSPIQELCIYEEIEDEEAQNHKNWIKSRQCATDRLSREEEVKCLMPSQDLNVTIYEEIE